MRRTSTGCTSPTASRMCARISPTFTGPSAAGMFWLNQNMPAAEGPVKVGEILAHMRDAVGDVQPVEVRRIALNYDQVLAYHPPPNPAKLTDSRANGYIDEHGHDSWELDALRPDVLADLIRQHVAGIRDEDAYDAIAAQETRHRDLLTLASERWADRSEEHTSELQSRP